MLDPVLALPTVIAEFGFQPAWLTAAAPTNIGTVAALNLTVDVGEAEAIALAHERRCRIILDDRKARVVAVRLGVPVTGTVGLLLKAKQAGDRPGATYARLTWLQAWHIRDETYSLHWLEGHRMQRHHKSRSLYCTSWRHDLSKYSPTGESMTMWVRFHR